MLNGGYTMIYLSSNTLYDDLIKAKSINKPILIYDSNFQNPYFIDKIIIDNSITLIKNDYKLIIDKDNNITTSGELGYTLIDDIIDSNGNQRFIEGGGTVTSTTTGLTFNYIKWSLSGTHLMLVVMGTAEVGTVINWSAGIIVTFNDVPTYITNKISTVRDNYVDYKSATAYGTSTTQELGSVLQLINSELLIRMTSSVTIASENKTFRIQYDLLIDND